MEGAGRGQQPDVVLGEDWIGAQGAAEAELRNRRERRGVISINRSPLARKIITFNLLAILVLVAGVLLLNPFRDSLVFQREQGIVNEAQLIAAVFQAQRPPDAPVDLATGEGLDPGATLMNLAVPPSVEVFVFGTDGALVATTVGQSRIRPPEVEGLERDTRSTAITDFLTRTWEGAARIFSPDPGPEDPGAQQQVRRLVDAALAGTTQSDIGTDRDGNTIFAVATPILQDGAPVGVIALTSAAGEIDQLVRAEREQVLHMFIIAILVSIGLSLVLASTIANPLSDLAAAAEIGREKNAGRVSPGRVRIPDLTARPDEIGRLSGALRGMVAALYDRIDANEQFAADVAHEIKNPLASLRSAVGTLRVAKRDDQRDRLLDVIEHDVRRLDRLVSDISNASRLDSELVREEEEQFNLLDMIRNLSDHLGKEE